MSIYTTIYHDHYSSLDGKLKPVCCDGCQSNGCCVSGECERCLENQAYNVEYIETHTFITDYNLGCYHSSEHDSIKKAKLRMPDEHPRLYYGIEIEVAFDYDELNVDDAINDYGDEAEKMEEILTGFTEITDGLFVYEQDGSLNNGMEFISRPCSYAYWTNPKTVEKLKKGLEFLNANGALGDQPDGYGLHIHLSRAFFNAPTEERKVVEAQSLKDFDWLFQKFQEEIEELGGRKYSPDYSASKKDKLRREISFNNNYGDVFNAEVKAKIKLKRGGSVPCGDHGWAVNLGRYTIEARVFKSTLDYREILSRIELVRNFAHAVRTNQIDDTLDAILHTKENLYLDDYIRRKKISLGRRGRKLDLSKKNDNEIEVKL